MRFPFWPPPRSRAPRHQVVSKVLFVVLQFTGMIAGLGLAAGNRPNAEQAFLEPTLGMLIGLGLWWLVCIRLWKASCPDCGTSFRCKLWFHGRLDGKFVSLTYDCPKCGFRYPASFDEEKRDSALRLFWFVAMTMNVVGAIFFFVVIGLGIYTAIAQDFLQGLCLAALGGGFICVWLVMINFMFRLSRSRIEKADEASPTKIV